MLRYAMIHDVDESLRALVRRDALSGSQVEIAFDAPTKDWVARRNSPTLDLYLYDIREDLQRREVAYEPVRDGSGIVTEHRPPARRFRLSYLVTAWTQRPEDEHRILSATLGCFIRNAAIPSGDLAGQLVEATVPVYLQVALPPPQDRSLADVWSALGGELKPSLDLVVTAPLDASIKIEAAPPVREVPRIRVLREDGSVEYVADAVAVDGAARRGRRPLSSAEPAMQEEAIVAGAREAGPAGAAGAAGAARGGRRRRGAAGVERAEGAGGTDGGVPGRRIIVRGFPRP